MNSSRLFGRVVEVLQVADVSDVSLVHPCSLESYLEVSLERIFGSAPDCSGVLAVQSDRYRLAVEPVMAAACPG